MRWLSRGFALALLIYVMALGGVKRMSDALLFFGLFLLFGTVSTWILSRRWWLDYLRETEGEDA
jgi:hypothetical protein